MGRRKLLAGIFGAALLAASSMPVSAAMLINPYVFAAESATQAVTYLGSLAFSSGSTITGSIDIGDAHSKKEIFLVCASSGATARTLTAASTTVDGVAVTKSTTEVAANGLSLAVAFVSLPTNAATVTITATFSSTITSGTVAVYKVLNRTNRGNNETSAASATNGAAATLTVSTTVISAGGIWFGANIHANTNVTTSPATEDADAANGSNRCVQCHRDFQGAGSTPSDSWSWTGSVSCKAASWAYT